MNQRSTAPPGTSKYFPCLIMRTFLNLQVSTMTSTDSRGWILTGYSRIQDVSFAVIMQLETWTFCKIKAHGIKTFKKIGSWRICILSSIILE